MLNVASRELATTAADMAADRKANDIVVLELGSISSLADYFVVCSGKSHIQVDAICQRVVEGMRERYDTAPLSVEGTENGRWAVIDYGAIVVHVFQQSVREIYDLERLWNAAPRWNYAEGFDKHSARA